MSSQWNPPPNTRVIDVGARDARLAAALAERGLERYLAYVDPAIVQSVRARASELAPRFQPLADLTDIQRCSADLLVLRADYSRVVWGWGDLAHFRWLAVEKSPGARRWEVGFAAKVASLRGRLLSRGEWRIAGVGTFLLFEIGHVDRSARPRIYFSPVWGVEGLARRLAEEELDYAVLRWFETLPNIEPGEDLDILVRDEDVERFRALVESEPGTLPIDLYSVSGLDGSDFRGAAYYVPYLADRILDNAVVHSSGMRVPSAEDHLHSLAYHAAYHKGTSSGIRSALVATTAAPEHDYAATLASLASACERSVPADLEGLDDYLASVGWRPPVDALRRFTGENEWLDQRVDGLVATRSEGAELSVFLVRERALEVLREDEIAKVFARWGFELLASRVLDGSTRELASRVLRGGNWGRGPYPENGGLPSVLLVCVHYAPDAVPDSLRQSYPHLNNADVYLAKRELRDVIQNLCGADAAFNAVHSADDSEEAWHYLEIVAPDIIDDVRAELQRRASAQSAGGDVVATLSRGRRARVDVVSVNDANVVRKTYTEGALRFMQREMEAMDSLSGSVPAVPAILARGSNWFTLPFFDDTLAHSSGLLPLRVIRQMVDVLRMVRARGWVIVDAKPDNFVLDREAGLRIVDLEFAYCVDAATPPLHRGPEFIVPMSTAFIDVPAGDSSYATRWLPRTGLPLAVMLEGSPLSQVLHRLGYSISALTVAPGSPLRKRIRGMRALLVPIRTFIRDGLKDRAWRATVPTHSTPTETDRV